MSNIDKHFLVSWQRTEPMGGARWRTCPLSSVASPPGTPPSVLCLTSSSDTATARRRGSWPRPYRQCWPRRPSLWTSTLPPPTTSTTLTRSSGLPAAWSRLEVCELSLRWHCLTASCWSESYQILFSLNICPCKGWWDGESRHIVMNNIDIIMYFYYLNVKCC